MRLASGPLVLTAWLHAGDPPDRRLREVLAEQADVLASWVHWPGPVVWFTSVDAERSQVPSGVLGPRRRKASTRNAVCGRALATRGLPVVCLTNRQGHHTCCWDVDIFDLRTRRHHSISAPAQKDMAKRLKCDYSNVYFAKWQDANSIIIWLEGREPNTNRFSCRDGEHNSAYRIDVRSGKILQRYGPKETQRIEESE